MQKELIDKANEIMSLIETNKRAIEKLENFLKAEERCITRKIRIFYFILYIEELILRIGKYG